MLTINGTEYAAQEFVWDGCHKIYLLTNPEDRAFMEGNGYEGEDFQPVSELARVWEDTCPLRFISRADLKGPDIVPQGYENEPVIEVTDDETSETVTPVEPATQEYMVQLTLEFEATSPAEAARMLREYLDSNKRVSVAVFDIEGHGTEEEA